MSVFGWEYPPGSMVGSGIYSEDWTETRFCTNCGEDQEGTGWKNDYGTTGWDCDVCGMEYEDDPYDDVPEPPEDWDEAPDAHLDDPDY